MVDRRSFSQKKRAEIFARDGGKCGLCGFKILNGSYEIDHVAALVHEGSNDDDNLRPVHVRCHREKSRLDVAANAKVKRIAAGGKTRRGRGFRGWRRFNGEQVWNDTNTKASRDD